MAHPRLGASEALTDGSVGAGGAAGVGVRAGVDGKSMASAFAERWKGAPDPAEVGALETALVELWERGRDAWPDVPLDARAFATYVGERASAKLAPVAAVGEVRAADAFLACACTIGLPSAIRAFDSNLLSRVPLFLGSLRKRPDVVDETRQQLLEKLFVAEPGKPAKISSYGARGALEGWVRVVAIRVALNIVEAERSNDSLDANTVALGGNPELELLKLKYRDEFVAAFREAMASLPKRDRTMLRFTYVEQVTPARIGEVYGVHRTTALRWVESAHGEVLARTRTGLMARLDVSPSECDSLIELMKSQLDVTLGALVRTG